MATAVRVTKRKVFVPGPPPGFEEHSSGLLHPQIPRMSDLSAPDLMTHAVTNIMGVHDRATPQEREEGRTWYPKVHDATAKGVRVHRLDSMLHGAGIVSAVSPNMDFEQNNIHAFDELAKMRSNPEHMAALHRSLNNVVHGTSKKGEPLYLKSGEPKMVQKRTPEWAGIINQHYPNVSHAPDNSILKAHRIMEGEHPDSVLNPQTAPKTNSFAHNIADPSRADNPHNPSVPLATIDGRAHDLATNTLHGWGVGRGISSAVNKGGTSTRYEHFASGYGQAAQVMSSEQNRTVPPSEAQAVTWVAGKRMEREMPGAKRRKATGEPYQGPQRQGQRYL